MRLAKRERILAIRHKKEKLLPLEITLTNGEIGPSILTDQPEEICTHMLDTNYRVQSIEAFYGNNCLGMLDIILDKDGTEEVGHGCGLIRQLEKGKKKAIRRQDAPFITKRGVRDSNLQGFKWSKCGWSVEALFSSKLI